MKAREKLKAALGGGSRNEDDYIYWVKKQYQDGRAKLLGKHPGDKKRDRWERADALVRYDRCFTLDALDWAVDIWPAAKSSNASTVERFREVFVGPYGALWNSRDYPFFDRFAPPGDLPAPLGEGWRTPAVAARCGDRLDALKMRYEKTTGGGAYWTGWQGGSGGQEQETFWATRTSPDAYIDRFSIRAHVGWSTQTRSPYCCEIDRFAIGTNARDRSPWWGAGSYYGCKMGHDYELVEQSEDSFRVPDHRITTIAVSGPGWNYYDEDKAAAGCLFVGFQPVNKKISSDEPKVGRTYVLVNRATGKAMDLSEFSHEDDVLVAEYPYPGTQAQHWQVGDAGGGRFWLKNSYTDAHFLGTRTYQGGYGCLTARKSVTGPGATWLFGRNYDGTYTLAQGSASTSRVALAVEGKPDGEVLLSDPRKGKLGERWHFVDVTTSDRLKKFRTRAPVARFTEFAEERDRNYYRAEFVLTNPATGSPVKDWHLSCRLPLRLGTEVTVSGPAQRVSAERDRRGLRLVVKAADWSRTKDLSPGATARFTFSGGAHDPGDDIRNLVIKPADVQLNGYRLDCRT